MPGSPNQIGYTQGGVEFGVTVDQQDIASRVASMPAGGVSGKHHDIIGEEHRAGREQNAGGSDAIQAAVGGGRIANRVEHVRIADPLEEGVRLSISPPLIARTGDHFLIKAIVVERAIGSIKKTTLAGRQIIVGASGPDKPFHALEVDVGGGPKEVLTEIGQVQLHRDARLVQL